MLAPIESPFAGICRTGEKEFNEQVNKIRYVIERFIANFKAWRITRTDYGRPYGLLQKTIQLSSRYTSTNWPVNELHSCGVSQPQIVGNSLEYEVSLPVDE